MNRDELLRAIHEYADEREIDYTAAQVIGERYGMSFADQSDLIEWKQVIDHYLKSFNESEFQDIQNYISEKTDSDKYRTSSDTKPDNSRQSDYNKQYHSRKTSGKKMKTTRSNDYQDVKEGNLEEMGRDKKRNSDEPMYSSDDYSDTEMNRKDTKRNKKKPQRAKRRSDVQKNMGESKTLENFMDDVLDERKDYRDERGEVPGEQDTGPHEYEKKKKKRTQNNKK